MTMQGGILYQNITHVHEAQEKTERHCRSQNLCIQRSSRTAFSFIAILYVQVAHLKTPANPTPPANSTQRKNSQQRQAWHSGRIRTMSSQQKSQINYIQRWTKYFIFFYYLLSYYYCCGYSIQTLKPNIFQILSLPSNTFTLSRCPLSRI